MSPPALMIKKTKKAKKNWKTGKKQKTLSRTKAEGVGDEPELPALRMAEEKKKNGMKTTTTKTMKT